MASNVVPVNPVIVELVKDSKAVFGSTSLLGFAVVGLRLLQSSAFGPVVLITLRGRGQLLEGCGPEPSVYVEWLKVGAVAALEVAQTSRSPYVFYLSINSDCDNEALT